MRVSSKTEVSLHLPIQQKSYMGSLWRRDPRGQHQTLNGCPGHPENHSSMIGAVSLGLAGLFKEDQAEHLEANSIRP